VIVVDTSVWIDHFGRPEPDLKALVASGDVCLHPYVFGELLLGGLPANGTIAEQLQLLPAPPVAKVGEAATFIGWAGLTGTGVGYVDAHLLVSARLLGNGSVLTRDKRLRIQAKRLGLAYQL